jgi:hypothetical protein
MTILKTQLLKSNHIMGLGRSSETDDAFNEAKALEARWTRASHNVEQLVNGKA